MNYANLAWASTHKINLKKIHSQQKHPLKKKFDHDRSYLKTVFDHDRYYLKTVFDHDRYYHTKELFRSGNVLNVYKLNLLNISIFMQK